ncbi:hypothetical protein AAZX31_06G217100 [Glycine max]
MGLDMKLGYCAQGHRTKKVGVVDSEYFFIRGYKLWVGVVTELQRYMSRPFLIVEFIHCKV